MTQLSITKHLFNVTHWQDIKAKEALLQLRSLPQIQEDILVATAATKAALPWLKLARFGAKRTSKGSLRHNENVISISGVELDYDGEKLSFARGLAMLQEVRCRGIIYTSPSYTSAKPRWRLLLPTSQELFDLEQRKILVGRVDGFFGKVFAKESYTLSTSYFFGRIKGRPKVRTAVVDGQYVDLIAELAGFDPPRPPPPDPAMMALMVQDAGRGVSQQQSDHVSFAPMTTADLENEIRFALSVIPSDDRVLWIKLGFAIFAGLGEPGFEVFDDWSQGSHKYDPSECERKWFKDICTRQPKAGFHSIFAIADEIDPGWRDQWRNYMRGGEVLA